MSTILHRLENPLEFEIDLRLTDRFLQLFALLNIRYYTWKIETRFATITPFLIGAREEEQVSRLFEPPSDVLSYVARTEFG